jgi:uncharacterized protein (DUF952 family)
VTSTSLPPVDRPARLFHFADAGQWQAQRASGVYAPPGWLSDGFIHCATRAQMPGVVARHLSGRVDLLLLTLDAAALGDTLRYDWSEASGDWYPHVYAAIPVAAVLAVHTFDPTSGEFPR